MKKLITFILLSTLVLGMELSGYAEDIQEETPNDQAEALEETVDEPYQSMFEEESDQEDLITEDEEPYFLQSEVYATASQVSPPGSIAVSKSGQWIQSSDGRWWYKHNDGTYTKEAWEFINNKWYHFDSSGWMQSGWIQVVPFTYWFYLGGSDDGAMKTGWQKVNGKWYYMASNGTMQTGWIQLSGTWYYLSDSGAMLTGWVKIGGKWYYLQSNGAMLRNDWIKSNNKWYYLGPSGAMVTSDWVQTNGKWYYLDTNGIMLTETKKSINDNYYYYSYVPEFGFVWGKANLDYEERYVLVGNTKYYTEHNKGVLYMCGGSAGIPNFYTGIIEYSNGKTASIWTRKSIVYDPDLWGNGYIHTSTERISIAYNSNVKGLIRGQFVFEDAAIPISNISISQYL